MKSPKSASLFIDGVVWILILILAAIIAFTLMSRDLHAQFGAISYGSFPKFKLNTIEGKLFDDHEMKGHVWAVHLGKDGQSFRAMANALAQEAKVTWTDKRHLFVLSLVDNKLEGFKPLVYSHYIVPGSTLDIKRIQTLLGSEDEESIFLVDQNGIIRGIYKNTPSSFFKFNQDILKLL